MKWWLQLFVKNELFVRLRHFTYFLIGIMAIWFIPVVLRLLIIFALGGVVFFIGLIYSTIILLQFKRANMMPNFGTVGNWVVQIGGFLFTAGLVLPSLFAFHYLVTAPVTPLSYWITFTFIYPVYTFYLISKRGYDIIRGVTPGRKQ